MQPLILSTFAAAALLSLVAGGSAMARTEPSFPPPSEPLRLGGIGRPAAATEPAVPGSFRTAFTYIELLVVKSGGLSKNKKGLRANRQGTNKARKRARKLR
jgi:hypothetical protein